MNLVFRLFAGLSLVLFAQLSSAERISKNWLLDQPNDIGIEYGYNPGPDPRHPMGAELINLYARYPYMPGVSKLLTNSQKFRYHFGPTMDRMFYHPNTMKIFMIGQDATHVAEAAKYTATAGFGGRAQDFAAHFGVYEGVGFANAWQNTIRGQYANRDTPFVSYDRDGNPRIEMGTYVPHGLWEMTHGNASPQLWTDDQLDWVIRNNRQSLGLIFVFGQAAQDALASFINRRGGKVKTFMSEDEFKNVRMPEVDLKYGGGNNMFPVPMTKEGRDLYAELAGRRLDYSKDSDKKLALKLLRDHQQRAIDLMAFSDGGPYQNGLIHPGQLGGYSLRGFEVAEGIETISLKGLRLSDGTVIDRDIIVAKVAHPTYLSMYAQEHGYRAASDMVENGTMKHLRYWADRLNWSIEPDAGHTNHFARGHSYRYGRTQISEAFYGAGTPDTREVPVSSASRIKPNVISNGSRDRDRMDRNMIQSALSADPAEPLNPDNIWTHRPRTPEDRVAFDPGPGLAINKIIQTAIDKEVIYKEKPGKSFEQDGIDAYYTGNDPDKKFFGAYRGEWIGAKVIVMADPHGWDPISTSRALTGERGQYLHSAFKSAGLEDDYLVIRTVPFNMDGKSQEDWDYVMKHSESYREQMMEKAFEHGDLGDLKVLVADGPNAADFLNRKYGHRPDVKIIELKRSSRSTKWGIGTLNRELNKTGLFETSSFNGRRANIPYMDLPYNTRAYEGSVETVFTTNGALAGQIELYVAPDFATRQRWKLDPIVQQCVDVCRSRINDHGLRPPGMKVKEFMRKKAQGRVSNKTEGRADFEEIVAGRFALRPFPQPDGAQHLSFPTLTGGGSVSSNQSVLANPPSVEQGLEVRPTPRRRRSSRAERMGLVNSCQALFQ